jgi:hypothetical protein
LARSRQLCTPFLPNTAGASFIMPNMRLSK